MYAGSQLPGVGARGGMQHQLFSAPQSGLSGGVPHVCMWSVCWVCVGKVMCVCCDVLVVNV